MKLERLSWGLFLQIMIFIALIVGLIRSEWALSLLIWLSRKTKNIMTRLEISYYEHIDEFIAQLQKANKKIKLGIKILSFIFVGLILASIILLLVHQPVYAALCVLILALGPFLLAHALGAVALDLIAMPIAGLAAWLLLIAFNFIVWPPGAMALGWRLSILILLMLISSAFVISGRKTRGAPLILAIALSVSMMVYSSSSFLQAMSHRLSGKLAISTASGNRWASADQRKAEAIREFTKGIIVEDGLLRDKDNPKTRTQKAVKNMSAMIEYQDNKPIRPETTSALSREFKGSFCKVYLPDEHGSFPKTGQAWWIEDVKIQDTGLFISKTQGSIFSQNQTRTVPEHKVKKVKVNKNMAGVWWSPEPEYKLSPSQKVTVEGNAGFFWGFDNQAQYRVGASANPPPGARGIKIMRPGYMHAIGSGAAHQLLIAEQTFVIKIE